MIIRIQTSTVTGINSIPVEVEIKTWESHETEPNYFNIVGLGDNAVREARERVRSALMTGGFRVPKGILVNLSPAELKKTGSSFDLSIAIGILVASQQLPYEVILNRVFIGELGLDGRLNSVKGAVITAIDLEKTNSKKNDKIELILPFCNLIETSIIKNIQKRGAVSLVETIAYLINEKTLPDTDPNLRFDNNDIEELVEVKGQEHAKKALLVAGCGGHNLLMIGPPGCGKSLLAKNFKSLLPPLTFKEKLEVMKVYSISGLPMDDILQSKRPFRAPHHSASLAGIIGGGSPPRPGEISLAHRGVLFFDEIPEFPRPVLEALRAPLEDGIVRIVRAKESQEFPANFQFIAAMNPCPCGKLGLKSTQCDCSVQMISNYVNRISQPIMDRIDMHLQLNPVPIKQLITSENKNEIGKVRDIINVVVEKQLKRQNKLNSELSSQEILEIVKPNEEIIGYLDKVAESLALSARGCMKVLKIAQTIADIKSIKMNEDKKVDLSYIKEAVGYRKLEKYSR